MATLTFTRVFRKRWKVEDLGQPDLAVPKHDPPTTRLVTLGPATSAIHESPTSAPPVEEVSTTNTQDSRARDEPTPSVGHISDTRNEVKHAADERASSRRVLGIKFGNSKIKQLKTQPNQVGSSSRNDSLDSTPQSQAPGPSQSCENRSQLIKASSKQSQHKTVASPAKLQVPTGADVNEHCVTVSKTSPNLQHFDKDIWIGKLREHPPPEALEAVWLEEIRIRVVNDLQPVIQLLPRSTSPLHAIIEPDFCMTGTSGEHSDSVKLRPTVWIRCGSKRCKKVVKAAIEDMDYLHRFGSVQVHLRAPILASKTGHKHLIPMDLTVTRGQVQVLMPDVFSTHGFSACGLKIRVQDHHDSKVEHQWVVGGIIRVAGVIYGLTTAHSLVENPRDGDISTVDDTDDSETESDKNLPISGPPLEPRSQSRSSAEWTTVTIDVMNYAGHSNAESDSGIAGCSDYALIGMGPGKETLYNFYEKADSPEERTTNTCTIDAWCPAPHGGDVDIICAPNDVRPGWLLKGSSMIITRNGIFTTRKIQTQTPLAAGMSGTWVVCGSTLVGMIIAIYAGESYAHMLPITDVFSDIQSLLGDGGDQPPVDLAIAHDLPPPLAKIHQITIAPDPHAEISIEKDRRKRPEAETEKAAEPELDDGRPMSRVEIASFGILAAALCVSSFAVGFDSTAFPIVIPSITDRFKSISDIGLYGSVYLLSISSLATVMPQLLERYCRSWSCVVAIFVFVLGSILSAVAPSSSVVIVGRAVSGIGAVACWCANAAGIAMFAPKRKQPHVQAWLGLSHGVGIFVGPLLGGVFAQRYLWRWYFYFNASVGGLAAALMIFGLAIRKKFQASDSRTTAREPTRTKYVIRDAASFLVGIAAPLLLIFGLYLGPSRGWRNAVVIVLLVLAWIAFGLMLLIRAWKADGPNFLRRGFSWRVWTPIALSGLWGCCFYPINHFFPIWLQSVKNFTATRAGVLFLPSLGSSMATSMILGAVALIYFHRYKVPRTAGPATSNITVFSTSILLVSLALMATGCGLFSTLTAGVSLPNLVGYQILFGVGTGMGSSFLFAVVQEELRRARRDDESAVATRAVTLMQSLGGCISITAAQTIFMSLLKPEFQHLASIGAPIKVDAIGATDYRSEVPPAALNAAVAAYNKAITRSFFYSTAVGGLVPGFFVAGIVISGAGLVLCSPCIYLWRWRKTRTNATSAALDAANAAFGGARAYPEVPGEMRRYQYAPSSDFSSIRHELLPPSFSGPSDMGSRYSTDWRSGIESRSRSVNSAEEYSHSRKPIRYPSEMEPIVEMQGPPPELYGPRREV
ncbi:hypothetical protein EJ04DRAFT_569684 [Polyplosphaeria fusca]|uniref:Major facilitator superfamily (MFS) profile domain-containing protein n=1 Tax=Polyplosphaeria fusca TaxID=682080 RepID=A0A9P4UTV4_9PLEO|nr:hypothetical protein EJ04DRAFT_569684 [Polyplosphaeria fusca]